ncbi:extracellular solute-binding protein [Paenibacillus eucommiae]|uniref:Aldouronate transport system substrate-binding protein n=1 Tax=Paenibacillus eucommiae TaxID=1355755 RepID=A0ABS4IPA3_9BACL|nr:extracellular solute-binding protein [Paenibacillus eucommiae]MBP1989345.1 putative aldouronate transport system substrate-binding protein [Paenibacillus eucommiae]
MNLTRGKGVSLLLLFALVLAACSSGKGSSNGDGSKSSQVPDLTAAQQIPKKANLPEGGKYDPPIELTTVRVQQPTVKFANGDSMENNYWTRAYEEKYGIKLKTLWAVDPSQFEQKMNLSIASGEIPDFFQVSAVQFMQLAEAGMLADLTEVYEKHASDGVKALLTEEGNIALDSATIDGKLMAIPFTSPSREGAQMLYVRVDWLKKLNLPEPKTMDDVLKISEAFTSQDPDGNKKQDTYGLAVDMDFYLLTGFFNSFHAYPRMMIKDDADKLTYGTIQPEIKTAFGKLQEMFRGGQIDPEFGAKNANKVYESIANGKIGMFYNPPYAGLFPLQAAKEKDPSMEWKAFALTSADDKPALSQAELGVAAYWVVKKGVQHPEAVLKLLDFWREISYENNIDDIFKKQYIEASNEDEQVWLLNAISAYKSFKNIEVSLRVIQALETSNTSELTTEEKSVYDKIQKFQGGDNSNWGYNLIFNKGGSMSVADYYRKNNLYLNNELTTAPFPSMVENNATLAKMETEALTKIILNLAPLDSFDDYAEQWHNLGGTSILKELNDWYAAKSN